MSNTDFTAGADGPGGPSVGADSGRSPDPVATAKDMAGQAKDRVMQEAQSFAASAQDAVKDQTVRRKDAAGQAIGQFASAVRHAGDELAENDQSMAGHMIRQAADGLEGFARAVSDKRPEELLQGVRDFGRSNPVAFVAGAALAGFAIGRFFRSSAQHGSSQYGFSQYGSGQSSAMSVASPGPALTTPEEIGTQTAAGGPMPDAITPGGDTLLSASPAIAGHGPGRAAPTTADPEV